MARNSDAWTIEEIDACVDALMDIQFAIIDIMDEKSLTKKELADRLGVTPARISQILSSGSNPSIRQIGRVFHALGVDRPFKYLVPREQEIEKRQKIKHWKVLYGGNAHSIHRAGRKFSNEMASVETKRVAA